MKTGRHAWLAALAVVAACAPAAAAEPACGSETFEAIRYTVCRFDPAAVDLRVFWADASGKPYGSFKALEADLARRGLRLDLAVNGGMYHPGLAAVGLLVESGRQRVAINNAWGFGNFFLHPNGVFWLKDGRAGVTETTRYRDEGIDADQATQSGPMLVIDGKIHPRFDPAYQSPKIRNGVGIDPDGRVVLALTEDPVNFHGFARFYRDHIGARNALFLDGSISSLHWPAEGRSDAGFPLGPIIGVVGKAAPAPETALRPASTP
jgi:uncharacterized protein YigE (DUF2233 family)